MGSVVYLREIHKEDDFCFTNTLVFIKKDREQPETYRRPLEKTDVSSGGPLSDLLVVFEPHDFIPTEKYDLVFISL